MMQFARNGGDREGGWSNLLVFVVLAVIYGLRMLAARAKVSKQQQVAQPGQKKPVTKPPEGIAARPKALPAHAQRPQVQQVRRKVERRKPAVQRPAARTRPIAGLESKELTETPELWPAASQLRLKLEKLPDFTGKALKKNKKRGVDGSDQSQPTWPIEVLLDYTDTDKLKRAILHYEILGKPLSLRGQAEHDLWL